MIFPPPASCGVDTKLPQFWCNILIFCAPPSLHVHHPAPPLHASLVPRPTVILRISNMANPLYFTPPSVLLRKRRTIRQSSPSVIYACRSTTLKLDLLFADKVVNLMRCVFMAAQYHHSPGFYTFTTRFQIAVCSMGIETHLIKVPATERRTENAHGARTVQRKRKGWRDVWQKQHMNTKNTQAFGIFQEANI